MPMSDEQQEVNKKIRKAQEKQISMLRRQLDNTEKDFLKYKNRATCWEKAARNAGNRYDRLKAAVEGLLDRYASVLAEDQIAGQMVEGSNHESQHDAEAAPR